MHCSSLFRQRLSLGAVGAAAGGQPAAAGGASALVDITGVAGNRASLAAAAAPCVVGIQCTAAAPVGAGTGGGTRCSGSWAEGEDDEDDAPSWDLLGDDCPAAETPGQPQLQHELLLPPPQALQQQQQQQQQPEPATAGPPLAAAPGGGPSRRRTVGGTAGRQWRLRPLVFATSDDDGEAAVAVGGSGGRAAAPEVSCCSVEHLSCCKLVYLLPKCIHTDDSFLSCTNSPLLRVQVVCLHSEGDDDDCAAELLNLPTRRRRSSAAALAGVHEEEQQQLEEGEGAEGGVGDGRQLRRLRKTGAGDGCDGGAVFPPADAGAASAAASPAAGGSAGRRAPLHLSRSTPAAKLAPAVKPVVGLKPPPPHLGGGGSKAANPFARAGGAGAKAASVSSCSQ